MRIIRSACQTSDITSYKVKGDTLLFKRNSKVTNATEEDKLLLERCKQKYKGIQTHHMDVIHIVVIESLVYIIGFIESKPYSMPPVELSAPILGVEPYIVEAINYIVLEE